MEAPTTKAMAGAAIEDVAMASTAVATTRTASRPAQVGLRRQSKPDSAPTAVSRVSASASVAVVTNTIDGDDRIGEELPAEGLGDHARRGSRRRRCPGTPGPQEPANGRFAEGQAGVGEAAEERERRQPAARVEPRARRARSAAPSAASAAGELSQPTAPPARLRPAADERPSVAEAGPRPAAPRPRRRPRTPPGA